MLPAKANVTRVIKQTNVREQNTSMGGPPSIPKVPVQVPTPDSILSAPSVYLPIAKITSSRSPTSVDEQARHGVRCSENKYEAAAVGASNQSRMNEQPR